MAHWIIIDHGNYNVYECSYCHSQWSDNTEWTNNISNWIRCPKCNKPIYSTRNEHRADLVYIPEEREEKEKQTIELNENFVVLTIEKYDEMKSDLVKLGEANRNKERCLDILKEIGLTEDYIKRIDPSSCKLVETKRSPYTMRSKLIFSFEMDDDRMV